jgi:hypothetical protein
MARLDRLAPVKEVAQIGAVTGREFSYEVLVAVAHRPAEQLGDALDQLVGAGLIFRRGTGPEAAFIFKHAFVQDAAYSTLLRGRRQELHSAIAKVLEERVATASENESRAGEHAALLAHHWRGAEDWEKAFSYTLEAASRAAAFYSRPEAISRYWQALELFERLPGSVERNRVHADVILSLIWLPGCMQDEGARSRLLRHVDHALENATSDGNIAAALKLQVAKGLSGTMKPFCWMRSRAPRRRVMPEPWLLPYSDTVCTSGYTVDLRNRSAIWPGQSISWERKANTWSRPSP